MGIVPCKLSQENITVHVVSYERVTLTYVILMLIYTLRSVEGVAYNAEQSICFLEGRTGGM